MEKAVGLHINDKDNVATIFLDMEKDQEVEIRSKDGSSRQIRSLGEIPYGHKIAIRDIAPGERILKYGEEIGAALSTIRTGEHVHVHNLESIRGRGDWENSNGEEKKH